MVNDAPKSETIDEVFEEVSAELIFKVFDHFSGSTLELLRKSTYIEDSA